MIGNMADWLPWLAPVTLRYACTFQSRNMERSSRGRLCPARCAPCGADQSLEPETACPFAAGLRPGERSKGWRTPKSFAKREAYRTPRQRPGVRNPSTALRGMGYWAGSLNGGKGGLIGEAFHEQSGLDCTADVVSLFRWKGVLHCRHETFGCRIVCKRNGRRVAAP